MSDSNSKCEICHALIDEEDLFCSNCGAEAPQRQSVNPSHTRTATHNFECQGCGASMSYDASAGSLRCPFCGSERLDKKGDSRALSPSRVVPFVVSRDAAIAKMRVWLGRGFWRPGDLSEQAMVVSMTPVYVPYWVFEAQTHTFWTADSSRTPPGARGKWFPMSGEHRGRYAGLLVGASGALLPGETADLCPFELASGKPPAEIDLTNVTVEQFSVARKYARPRARHGLESMELAACRQRYVPGRVRNMRVNTLIKGLASEPVLLPVWIMAYRYKDKVFRFLANGQTGKCTGAAPTSFKKIGLVIGVILLVILLLFMLIGGIGLLGLSL